MALLLLPLLVAGCGARPVAPSDLFPSAGRLPAGWVRSPDKQTFDYETLYDLVDGQAEAYFAYGFEQVQVQRYEDEAGAGLDIELWRLASPADAFGLFTVHHSGTTVAIGNDADTDPGRRVTFWQDRYFVRLRTLQAIQDEDLRAFAVAVAKALPAGGERPALVNRLPRTDMVADSATFFHQEISIQTKVWLGGEDILGLGPDTDGVMARYDLGGELAWLLLVQYPDEGRALAGREALAAASVEGLVATGTHGSLLGAVLGNVAEAEAGALLAEALENE